MLIAFWAIIRDSFRAAMASRVLYVLLAIITLLLLLLAPLRILESLDWKVDFERHVQSPRLLAIKVFEGSKDGASAAQKKIWNGLKDETRIAIEEMIAEGEVANSAADGAADSADETAGTSQNDQESAKAEDAGRRGGMPARVRARIELENDLNEMAKTGDLFEPEIWGKRLGEEAQTLADLQAGARTRVQQQRLNRLLMTNVLAPELGSADASSLEFWYGPWQAEFATVSMMRAEFNRFFASTVSSFFDNFVMTIGLFIAILVTSNLIPEMFEPGSLNLLLSKPVPRWWLLLSKFVGGCAFITVCATYLFLGVWLWMGICGGLWDRGMLWSIPLYIIVFAIYFSVSTLVGIVYRSPIVAVILTVLFWAVCFGVGSAWNVFNARVLNDRIVSTCQFGDDLMAADCQQRFLRWDENARKWEEVIGHKYSVPEEEIAFAIVQYFEAFPIQHVLGPLEVGENEALLVGTPTTFNPERSVQFDLQVFSPPRATPVEMGSLPFNTVSLVAGKPGPTTIDSGGSFRVATEKQIELLSAAAPEKEAAKNAGRLFELAGPDKPESVRNASCVSVNPENGDIVLLNRNRLVRFRWDEVAKKYQRVAELVIESGSPSRNLEGWVAVGGKFVAAAWSNGTVCIVDLESMKELATMVASRKIPIRELKMTTDGSKLFVLLGDGNVLTMEPGKGKQLSPLTTSFRGRVCGIDIRDSEIAFCHTINRVTIWNPADGTERIVASPRGNWYHNLYNYGINPFYQIAPKPGEFYKLVHHLSSSSVPEEDFASIDLTKQPWSDSPWSPLWSGLVFMSATLGLGCILFIRQDY